MNLILDQICSMEGSEGISQLKALQHSNAEALMEVITLNNMNDAIKKIDQELKQTLSNMDIGYRNGVDTSKKTNLRKKGYNSFVHYIRHLGTIISYYISDIKTELKKNPAHLNKIDENLMKANTMYKFLLYITNAIKDMNSKEKSMLLSEIRGHENILGTKNQEFHNGIKRLFEIVMDIKNPKLSDIQDRYRPQTNLGAMEF